MLSKLKEFFLQKSKNLIYEPLVDRVETETVGFRLPHQGATTDYYLYSSNIYIGQLRTELWADSDLILVHSIKASTVGIKYGSSMVRWLVDNTSQVIQPVHVIGGGIGFWCKQKQRWPNRVVDQDIRSSEYDYLLEERKRKILE
ncbi:hypothetical protein H5187_21675 [Pseudoalteromonas sp. SG44-1]|uniref:hypothetical protein n=1 Tax=Pseudoalteromonas sp. SG44-1 TaxID=2760964 RepID=UPI001600DB81|nr:hypothetical protein [Pseudoalteromonas sp. SG44-1]MBB1419852.1 hypothetical protein [Pseudoalteromonas sp. SG44-1]